MSATEHWIVDVARFKEAVWAIDRSDFRPGDALHALERGRVVCACGHDHLSARTDICLEFECDCNGFDSDA